MIVVERQRRIMRRHFGMARLLGGRRDMPLIASGDLFGRGPRAVVPWYPPLKLTFVTLFTTTVLL